MKKLLTIDDLYRFCNETNFSNFSSADTGYKVVVQIPSTFEEVPDDDLTRAGLMRLKIKVAHIGKNRNNSYISEENMKKALPSLKNRPVLGYIHQLDNGTYDFWSHNMEIVEDEDGNESVEYLETQIGSFTEDEPFLEYDEENDKTYAVAYAVIPEGYSKAADIIRAKSGTKNSCELFIDKFVFNSQEKCIELVDFFFGGSTMLGSDDEGNQINEGMEGSRADIIDFAEDTNTVSQQENVKKGGSILLQTLLEKYGKTLDDLTFEYENLSDEELQTKFAEIFDNEDIDDVDDVDDDVDDVDDDVDIDEVVDDVVDVITDEVVESVGGLFDSEDQGNEDFNDNESEIDEEIVEEEIVMDESDDDIQEDDNDSRSFNVTYELSFNDIEYAIFELTNIYRNEQEFCYPFQVFNDYFLMMDWNSNRYYRQSYVIDENDSVSLVDDRQEVFAEYLTVSEKEVLDTMRSNYTTLERKVNEYEIAELNRAKEDILNDPVYADYLNSDAFTSLINNSSKYTLDEFKDQAEIAFAKCIKLMSNFDANNNTKQKTNRQRIAFGKDKKEEKRPYGNLFD